MRTATKLLPTVLVAILLACALVPLVDAEPSIPEDQRYRMDMRVGDTFEYTPETTLPAEFTMLHERDDIADVPGIHWNEDRTTILASFDDVSTDGMREVIIIAVWHSEHGDLTQTAYQSITFRSYGHVTIDGSTSVDLVKNAPVGTDVGAVVYTPAIPVADDGTVTTVTCSIADDNEHIAWDPETNSIVTKKAIGTGDVAEYTVTITATNAASETAVAEGSNLREESATATVRVIVGGEVAIDAPTMVETYVGYTGEDRNTVTFTSNLDGRPGITKEMVLPEDLPEGFVVSNADGVVTFDPSKAVIADGEENMTITITARVTGTVGEKLVEKEQTITYVVWKDLDFMSAPSIRDITFATVGDFGISFDASVRNADRVTVAWSQGATPVEVPLVDGLYSASHTYAAHDVYEITVVAEREGFPSVAHTKFFDTQTGEITAEPPADDSGSEKEKSWLWVLPIVIGGILVALYAFAGIRHPMVLVVAGICIVLGLLMYFEVF